MFYSIATQGPLEALVGLLFGTAYGALVAFLPARDQLYKIGLPGKLILRDYFQENMTS